MIGVPEEDVATLSNRIYITPHPAGRDSSRVHELHFDQHQSRQAKLAGGACRGYMKERFEGANRPHLIAALLRQEFCFGSSDVANNLADLGTLEEFSQNATIIAQGGEDSDMFFLLAGSVAVVVNGNQINERKAGEHVGEMSAIEPSIRRSATIIAQETVVALKVPAVVIGQVGEDHPHVWPAIARILARRLQERNNLIKIPNDSPKLFVISSSEALPVAREVADELQRDAWPNVWNEGVFFAGGYSLEALEAAVEQSDFAVAVCDADDIVTSRKSTQPAIRDNVLFELGLFMGRLTRSRAFLLHPNVEGLKVPSDLFGLTLLSYTPPKEEKDLRSAIARPCNDIRKAIKSRGVRRLYS